MFSQLYESISTWLATPQGVATSSIVILAGVILTVVFAITLSNLLSEIKEFKNKLHVRDVEIARLESVNVENQKKSEEYSASLSTQIGIKEKSLNELSGTLERTEQDLAITKERLGDAELKLVSADQEFARLTSEVNSSKELLDEQIEEGNRISRILDNALSITGFFGDLLTAIKATKTHSTRLFAVILSQKDGDEIAYHSKELTREEVDAVERSTQSGEWLAKHGSLEAEQIFSRIQLEMANIFPEDVVVSPVYFVEVNYIRSLDLKIVKTDMTLFSTNPRGSEILDSQKCQRIISEIASGAIRRTHTPVLILDFYKTSMLDGVSMELHTQNFSDTSDKIA